MTTGQKIHSKLPAKSHDTAQKLASPSNSLEEPLHNTDPSALNPGQVLHLQRTIGNQAVIRMFAKQKDSHGTIQRLPKYKDFVKGGEKMTGVSIDIFSSKYGEEAMSQARSDKTRFGNLVDINLRYQEYEKKPSTEALITLFDTITYWEALNNVNADQKWYGSAKFFIENVKDQIKDEIRAETTKQYGKASDLASLEKETQERSKKDQQFSAMMPDFMKKMGVAPRYFGKHLLNHPERIESLQKFYIALQTGKLKEAEQAYMAISNVPGMYLIKPLIVAHFSGNAELGNLVGTKSQAKSALTPQEREAIKIYSGGAFKAINAQLRNTLSEPPDAPMNFEELDAFLAEAEAIPERKSTMELAVSGMNKLPPYKGLAYRGLVWEPGGYFDVIQPGAMIVDLAFQSASPSLKGVNEFLTTQRGSKHIYFMIHTKSAVNIMEFSDSVKEGEILFKPGAKFQVKAVWHHISGGKVPPNAPAEAQMILKSQGKFKSAGEEDAQGNLVATNALSTGLTEKEAQDYTQAQQNTMKWLQVKVIEMVET